MSRRASLVPLLAPVLLGVAAPAHAVPAIDPTVPPAASAKPSKATTARSLLWATVNLCDTANAPDTIGIRGSMPGSGSRHEQMYMRIQVLFRDPADRRWKQIGPSGDSGWISVGSGRFRARQSGRNFVVRPPAEGASRLRGDVTYEWRRRGRVVRRATRRTTGGHPGTQGADPADFSSATCEVRA